jgi:hypothetical protein
MMRTTAIFCLFVAMLTAGTGCGAGQARLANDLKVTGLAYHSYHNDHTQGPPGWDELIKYAEETNNAPDAIRRVKDAGYEMTWNVKLGDVKGAIADTVLGKPTKGGPTLWMDGSVR